jgi:hypothetical protein
MPRAFYPQGNSPRRPWYSSLGGSQNRSGRGGEEKKRFSASAGNRNQEPRSPIPHNRDLTFKECLRHVFIYILLCMSTPLLLLLLLLLLYEP